MSEFYPQIKLVHVVAVLASGLLFMLRGTLVLLGRERWALAAAPRYLSYTIDTILVTAALALLSVLPSGLFANGWLTVKLLLLPAYVACAWLALRRGSRGRAGFVWFAGAIAIYAFMLVVARLHDPLGPLRFLELQ